MSTWREWRALASNVLSDTLGLVLLVVVAGSLGGFLLLLIFPDNLTRAPDWLLLSQPHGSCAVHYADGQFHAPPDAWVEFHAVHLDGQSSLPRIERQPEPEQEVRHGGATVVWAHHGTLSAIDPPIAPSTWIKVTGAAIPPTLTPAQLAEKKLPIGNALELRWQCAQPLVTFALLLELLGIGLTLLDLTGRVARFEAFLDRQRRKLRRWLFPWARVRRQESYELFENLDEAPASEDANQDLPLLTLLLGFVYLVLFTLFFPSDNLGWILLWFVAAFSAGALTDLALKWTTGALVYALWHFLDKAPNGTVGGIGLTLFAYGLTTNYLL